MRDLHIIIVILVVVIVFAWCMVLLGNIIPGLIVGVFGVLDTITSIIGRLIQARIANAPKISVSVQPVEVFNNRGRSGGMRKSILLYNSGEDAHNVWCYTKINGKEKSEFLSTLHKNEKKEICIMKEPDFKAAQIEISVTFEDVTKKKYKAHFSKDAGRLSFKTISTGIFWGINLDVLRDILR